MSMFFQRDVLGSDEYENFSSSAVFLGSIKFVSLTIPVLWELNYTYASLDRQI